MTKYCVVVAERKDEIERAVEELLLDGWMLQGGVSISHYEYEDRKGYKEIATVYAQAMVWMP